MQVYFVSDTFLCPSDHKSSHPGQIKANAHGVAQLLGDVQRADLNQLRTTLPRDGLKSTVTQSTGWMPRQAHKAVFYADIKESCCRRAAHTGLKRRGCAAIKGFPREQALGQQRCWDYLDPQNCLTRRPCCAAPAIISSGCPALHRPDLTPSTGRGGAQWWSPDKEMAMCSRFSITCIHFESDGKQMV